MKEKRFGSILSPDKNVSPLQMSLTLLLVICLILSNILVVKSIDLFGISKLANSCSILVFPKIASNAAWLVHAELPGIIIDKPNNREQMAVPINAQVAVIRDHL